MDQIKKLINWTVLLASVMLLPTLLLVKSLMAALGGLVYLFLVIWSTIDSLQLRFFPGRKRKSIFDRLKERWS